MSYPSALASVLYSPESSWAETSTTFSTRLPVVGAVDVSGLQQAKLDTMRVVQLAQGAEAQVTGFQGGSFKTKLWLPGHGSTTSGATSATSIPTLLAYALAQGSGATPPAGTTLTGGTATAPTTTASATFTAGQLCRIGANGDSRGNGQFYAVTSHVTTTLNLKTGMSGAPSNGDVLYSAETIYISELPSTTSITGLRFTAMSANLQYNMHGCWAKSISFGIPVNGELPFVEIEWGVSRWTYGNATFPTTTTPENFAPAPGGGAGASFFFNTYGTATRATRSIRANTNAAINVALNNIPIIGVGSVGTTQAIVGCQRGPAKITFEWTEDAPTVTTSPQLETDFETISHGLLTLSNTAGTAMGLYMPKMIPTGSKPVQFNDGGINRIKHTYQCAADETQTTNLLASALRIGFA